MTQVISPERLGLPQRSFRHAETSGRYINHGSDTSLDNLHYNAFSVLMWLNMTTRPTTTDNPIGKTGPTFPTDFSWQLAYLGSATDEFRFLIRYSTTPAKVQIDASGVELHEPFMLMATWDKSLTGTAKQDFYIGGLSSLLYRPTPTTNDAAVGTDESDAGIDLAVGVYRISDSTAIWCGDIYAVHLVARKLTLAEGIEQQTKGFHKVPGTVLLANYDGTLNQQRDLSGLGNHGTPQFAVAGADAPGSFMARPSAQIIPFPSVQVPFPPHFHRRHDVRLRM